MKRKNIAAILLGLLLVLPGHILCAQASGAEESAGIGVGRTTQIQIGEGYVTGTDSVEARITVLEVVRGDKSWDLVKAASSSNRPPETGMEYVAVRLRFEYGIKGGPDQTFGIRDEQFASLSQSGRQYGRPSVVHPKPQLAGRLYPGDSLEGWITLLVAVDDRQPLMTFGNNYNRVWFRLY
jgi:hypothetical protein